MAEGSERWAKTLGSSGNSDCHLARWRIIHHTLKFRALCKPNSVPSRILGVKVASGWPITTNFPSVLPDLPCPELFHWEERGRHKPGMLTWVPGVWYKLDQCTYFTSFLSNFIIRSLGQNPCGMFHCPSPPQHVAQCIAYSRPNVILFVQVIMRK